MKKRKKQLRRFEPDNRDFKLDELLGLDAPSELYWQVSDDEVQDYLGEVNEAYDAFRKMYPEVDADKLMEISKKYVHLKHSRSEK